MIQDPIIGDYIPNAFQTMIGVNNVFASLRLTNYKSDTIWSIGRWDRGYIKKYWYGEFISKELFVELLMNNYPDYFEWLLFHPEWL